MRKIVEYYILEGESIESLEASIKLALKDGLQPYGYLVATEECFYQGVVKYEDIHECLWEIKHAGNKATGYKTVQCVICQKQLENAIDNTRTNE